MILVKDGDKTVGYPTEVILMALLVSLPQERLGPILDNAKKLMQTTTLPTIEISALTRGPRRVM